MQVTFLGTGSAMPTGERYQTGIVVSDDDRQILVDCGSGILHRLQQAGVGYEAIDTVLLTHHHLDHVSDLMPLAKARWLAGETHLEVVGPAGTEELLDGLFGVHEYMQDRLDLTIRTVDADDTFSVAGFDIDAFETEHSMTCLAYRFGDKFTFSGDTEALPALGEFADGCAVLAHDCSFPDDVDVSNHPTPSQLGAALGDTDIGRVYLTHLYPHTNGHHTEMLESIEDEYDGDVQFADDLLTVQID